MCVDYQAPNNWTADAHWPKSICQKPEIFGIMGLTQGYHQAP